MNTAHPASRPDLPPTSEGHLYSALCAAFSSHAADIKLNSFGTGDCYTHLSKHSRSAQVYTGLGRQDFRLDFSEAGSMVAKGQTLELDPAVEALAAWLNGTSTVEDLIARHPACGIHRPQDHPAGAGAGAIAQRPTTSP
jgi:hypothetical protein